MDATTKAKLTSFKAELTSLKAALKTTEDDAEWYELADAIDTTEEAIVAIEHEELRNEAHKTGTLVVETSFDTYRNCKVSVNNYLADGTMCVDLWNPEEGAIARLTTCLSKKGMPSNQSYIDENNCPWAMDFIETYNLGWATGNVGFSGYCMYPVVEWNLEELELYK